MAAKVSRRAFMGTAIGGVAGATLAGSVTHRVRAQERLEWKNWSGSVTCNPQAIERPKTEAEISNLVRKANSENWSVRLNGSGHSFTPVCATDGMVMSLADMRGIVDTDREKLEATVLGGTKLQELHLPFREAGMAMENISDIDRQAIAGALGTGTHGTGHGIRNISTQAVGLRLVTADGEILECSPTQEPEIFEAAQVSLGALGIITQVRMRLMPTYRLHEKTWRLDFDTCFENLNSFIEENRHFEFFWSTARDSCVLKSLNITESMPDDLPDIPGERIGHSDVIFPSKRTTRFNEMEFSLPEENGPGCLYELRQLMLTKYPKIRMPLEYRTVGRDHIPLSMAHGRETVTISAHQLATQPHEAFFRDCEAVFRNHQGRPHWGKMHYHTAKDLADLYPKWDDFHAIRKRLDPKGRFMNDHLRELFG